MDDDELIQYRTKREPKPPKKNELWPEDSEVPPAPSGPTPFSDSTPGALPADEMELVPAGFWLRFLAHFSDWGISSLLSFFLGFVLQPVFGVFSIAVGMILAGMFYYIFFESSSFRATPGKMLGGLYVTGLGGEQISMTRATIRYFSKVLSAIPLMLGYVMVGFTKDKQGLHDLIAGTLVLRPAKLPVSKTLGSLFAAALFSGLAITFGYLLHEKRGNPDPVATMPDAVPTPQRPKPTIPPDFVPFPSNPPGYFQVGTEQIQIGSIFVRLHSIKERVDQLGVSEFDARRKRIEIAFFKDSISDSENESLLKINSLILDAPKQLQKEVLAELQIAMPEDQLACVRDRILQSTMLLSPTLTKEPAVRNVPLDLNAAAQNGVFDLTCPTLETGQKLNMTLQGRSKERAPEVFWNLRIFPEMHGFKSLGKFTFADYAQAVALWKQKEAVLEIGIFSESLGLDYEGDIKRARTVKGVAGNLPSMVISAQLSKDAYYIEREAVSRGYSVELIRDKKKRLTFPGPSDSLSVKYRAGEMPSTLSGQLHPSRRIIGRVEDHYAKGFEDGQFELSWDLAFNAEVIVIP